jgi:hypothetical protein
MQAIIIGPVTASSEDPQMQAIIIGPVIAQLTEHSRKPK